MLAVIAGPQITPREKKQPYFYYLIKVNGFTGNTDAILPFSIATLTARASYLAAINANDFCYH